MIDDNYKIHSISQLTGIIFNESLALLCVRPIKALLLLQLRPHPAATSNAQLCACVPRAHLVP